MSSRASTPASCSPDSTFSAGSSEADLASEIRSRTYGPIQTSWQHTLQVLQQPARARACGFGDRDRRPVTPGPILRLWIHGHSGEPVDVDNANFQFLVVLADLWSADGEYPCNIVKQPPSHTPRPNAEPPDSASAGSSYLNASTSRRSHTDRWEPNDGWRHSAPMNDQSLSHHTSRLASTSQSEDSFRRKAPPVSGSRAQSSDSRMGGGYGYRPYPMRTMSTPLGSGSTMPERLPSVFESTSSFASDRYRGYTLPAIRVPTLATSFSPTRSGPTSRPLHPGPSSRPDVSTKPKAVETNEFCRALIGSLTTTCQKLQDEKGETGLFFFLPDLCVRSEGTFRLRFTVMDIGSLMTPTTSPGSSRRMLAEAYSDPFPVYSAKNFPGVVPTTRLTRFFADQNVRIPTRIRRDKDDNETNKDDDGADNE